LRPPLFWFRDAKGRDYELSNISAGERAILPMLIDFATWEIHNSVILIDEVELHLHPPLQQALIAALPKLGNNNQFILTSHSDDVAAMFLESEIIRLEA
jgi:predicted ATP-dependent endonuclease of OLD family